MYWVFYVFFFILIMTLNILVRKKLLYVISPGQVLFYQYISSIIIICIYGGIIKGGVFFDLKHSALILFGALFALGVFSFNNAMKINLSRTMIAYQFTNFVSMLFAFFILHEYKLFDPKTNSGLLLILSIPLGITALFFMKGFGTGEVGIKWVVWNILFLFLLGFGTFLAKIFTQTISQFEILFFQYIGSFLTSTFILKIRKESIRIRRLYALGALLVGLLGATSLVFLYKAFLIAPLAYVNSLQTVGLALGGIFVGLIVFKERESLTTRSLLGMIIGIISVGFIVTSKIIM